MDDPVRQLTEVEAGLHALTTRLAAAIAAPDHPGRADDITALWSQIAAQAWPYAELVRAIRPGADDYALTDAAMAERRRGFQRLGPIRAKQWDRIGALVARQVQPFHAPLITETNNRRRGREDGYLHNMMRALFTLANPLAEDHDRVPDLNHRDIGLTGDYFVNLMSAIYRITRAQGLPRPARFIDVGCGGGTKVFVASSFFEVCDGLEYDAGYVTHARDWLGRVGAPGCRIMQGDALKFTDFASYDVIYMYRPIKDRALQVQLEGQILDQARPGTIIAAPLNYSLGQRPEDQATTLLDTIYLAHSTPAAAAALHDAATAIGPDPGLDDPHEAAEMGFWQPILSASRARGFEPAP